MSLDQNDRRAASRGMLGSGNTIGDTTKLATDYANTKYSDYVSKLSPYLNQQSSATQGAANVSTGLGNQLNTNDVSQGQLGYTAETGKGNANANAALSSYTTSGNLINALTNVAKLFSSSSGSTGVGNAVSSIFSGSSGAGYGGSPETNANLNPATYGNVNYTV